MAKLAIVSRKKWKAGYARPAKKQAWKGRRKTIRFHHTADAGPIGGKDATFAAECSYMRRVQAFHRDVRGWADIGYNYIIMPSGRVYCGRGFEKHGAHTLDDRTNTKATDHNDDPGVCFAGTYNRRPPSREALVAFWQLKHYLQERGVKIAGIAPHCATYATSCGSGALSEALGVEV